MPGSLLVGWQPSGPTVDGVLVSASELSGEVLDNNGSFVFNLGLDNAVGQFDLSVNRLVDHWVVD